MNDNTPKTDLDDEQIRMIRYILGRKAYLWVLSGRQDIDGMEVTPTDDDNLFLLKDIETGVEVGLRKMI